MKIKEIGARSIITESGLPDSDFVINPYIGCMHGCIYCYARFMKRFTDHPEPWGKFVDVKINAAKLIPKNADKYKEKSITISSVTDPYQGLEQKYKLMRGILKKLASLEPDLCIMTKSDLITRDIDLLKKFKNCQAGISLSTLNDNIRKELEPLAAPVARRVGAVRKLRQAGIRNFIFISPLFPEVTDYREIIEKTASFTDEFWFENLNIRASNLPNIKKWLRESHQDLIEKYDWIYSKESCYFKDLEQEITEFCEDKDLNFSIYFHHKSRNTCNT